MENLVFGNNMILRQVEGVDRVGATYFASQKLFY